MRFYRKAYRESLTEKAKFPCMVLVTNNWNDYGYETLFKLFYYPSYDDSRIEIGDVKILDLNLSETKMETQIKEDFLKLPEHQASLGQSIDYYSNLKEYLPKDFEKILDALNDVAINKGLLDEFEKHPAFKTSLLRYSDAEKALFEANSILYGANVIENLFSFTYAVQLPNANDKHIVTFDFHKQLGNSFRQFVLIGQNGTGKTQLLKNLATSLCDNGSPGEFIPSRPLFSRVIAISFSLFDKFLVPKTSKQFSYKYIGLRHQGEILSDEVLSNKLRTSFTKIRSEQLESLWVQFVNEIVDLKAFGVDIDFLHVSEKNFNEIAERRTELLSSGQNILIYIITELLVNLRRNSIVLFDEPETHLHPNAIAKFIKLLNAILRHFDSYAVIATHSPIVIQETPSSHVRIFDRTGNTPIVKELPEESFGENISRITDYIFYRNQVKESYKEFFDQKIKQFSINQINESFGNRLSMNALLYLNAISKHQN